jgi:hypothetical protein
MSQAPEVPTQAALLELRESARAAILRAWVNGQVLTADQMAQVSDLVPPRLLANPPAPRLGYRHEQVHYAGVYGCDLRTIKRYVGLGKKARRPCPLDDPAAMPRWWEEVKAIGLIKQAVSQHILDAAAKAPPPAVSPGLLAPAGSSAAPGASVPAAPSVALPGAGTKVDFGNLRGVGLEAAVRELEIQLDANQRALREAMERGENDIIVSKRKKHFEDTLDLLRKTEDSLQKLQAARGDLAPVSEFRSDLTTILTTLRGMKRKLAENVCAALADRFTPEQLQIVRDAIGVEARREETLLRNARHWQRTSEGVVILPEVPAAP